MATFKLQRTHSDGPAGADVAVGDGDGQPQLAAGASHQEPTFFGALARDEPCQVRASNPAAVASALALVEEDGVLALQVDLLQLRHRRVDRRRALDELQDHGAVGERHRRGVRDVGI